MSIMVSQFSYKHRCLVEKYVPIALILLSRWEDGAESLGIKRTNCLWQYLPEGLGKGTPAVYVQSITKAS